MTATFPAYLGPRPGAVHDTPDRACLGGDTDAFFHTTGYQGGLLRPGDVAVGRG